MNIANIFCQSLGVTSRTKIFLTVCRFQTDLVSVQKKCHPFERLGLSVWKNLSSVWTAWAIRSRKKNVICSNGLGYPFEKNSHPFKRLGISVWKNCYPFELLRQAIRLKKKLSTVRATEAICSKINFNF